VLHRLQPDQLVLGIDPDLHHAGVAVVKQDGSVIVDGVVLTSDKLTANDAVASQIDQGVRWMRSIYDDAPRIGRIVVESQRNYPGKHRHENPDDLIRLGQVAGALATAALQTWHQAEVWIVDPHAWKGSIRKEIMHQRIAARILEHGFTVLGPHRSHVLDAIGLALFGMNSDNVFKVGVGSSLRLARQEAQS
jgi:Holliday junction resolvasome RuvABC endonuclease subunit